MIWSPTQLGADSRTGQLRRGLARGIGLQLPAYNRNGRPARGLLFLAALTAAVVMASIASSAQAMQLSPAQKAEMKQHYEKATRAYDVQKYGEAVDEYQKAYEIGGDPAMLYNVAQSYRLNDQLQEALRFYRRYLQRSPNARNREDVERKIADLEKTVEERRKAAAATAPPPPPPTPVVTPVTPQPETPVIYEGGGGLRVAGIVIASVGAAGLIAAAVTGKMAKDKGDELTEASMKKQTFDPSVESSGKTLDTVTKISAIVGGAAAVTGVILIIASSVGGGPSTTEEPHASARPLIGPLFGGGVVGATAVVSF